MIPEAYTMFGEMTASQLEQIAAWGPTSLSYEHRLLSDAAYFVEYIPNVIHYHDYPGSLFTYRRFMPPFLIHDVFGNPFRPVTFDPAWRTSTVHALATTIYDHRAFDRLPVLADALQDAGCEHADVLDHCRGPGLHVRGCWVVDLVLGKS
jgi:hypothetical protein